MKIPRGEIQATEDGWLALLRGGLTIAEIATECGRPQRRVRDGIDEARLRERQSGPPRRNPIRLEPLFPITSFVPGSTCPHHGPIKRTSVFCCMICHATGRDDHPEFAATPDDPTPDANPQTQRDVLLTRRERRAYMTEWFDL